MLTVVLLGGLWPGRVWAQGIHFEHDSTLAAVKAKARAANKPIFIDCYTTWCGPCKWMARNIFPNDTAGRFFNQNFVSLKMDMEKGDGKKIGTRYKIGFYPTYLFLDTAGREIHRFMGAMKTNEFIDHARKALNRDTWLSTLKERYSKGERDPAFLRRYMMAAQMAGEPNVAEMTDWYFAFLPESELVTKDNFDVLEKTVYELHQPGFEKLYSHREKFMAVAGREKVNAKIRQVVERKFSEAFKWNLDKQLYQVNEEKYAEVLARVKAMDFDSKEEVLSEQRLKYYQGREDRTAYMETLKEHVPKYFWGNAGELNSYAWDVYENSDKKEDLELALGWSKRSLELSDDCYNNDTYAAICQKLKRKKEALAHAQKALKQAKEDGEDPKDYETRLEAIKKM